MGADITYMPKTSGVARGGGGGGRGGGGTYVPGRRGLEVPK